jgi:cytochrome c biogenesis protein CcdA
LGIFNFLYRLKAFWLVTRIANISIGVFSILLGFLDIYDFLKYKKTGQTEGLALQLPQAIKNRIHYVIGLHYRKTKSTEPQQLGRGKHIFKLTITALVTGCLVSILEAVCTGQTYLPTISFILKTTSLKLEALSYLVVYNFMFIVPLLIIFVFALLGVTSEQFANFLKKHLLAIKILMAILFFGFGIFLIWRA